MLFRDSGIVWIDPHIYSHFTKEMITDTKKYRQQEVPWTFMNDTNQMKMVDANTYYLMRADTGQPRQNNVSSFNGTKPWRQCALNLGKTMLEVSPQTISRRPNNVKTRRCFVILEIMPP